ncbi:hypothetical protein [Lentzea sp. NPDC060358]|uniref:hypothetical protein n=1 Tax=Lentzea sp. NPDC060358 TaxID=3347103 RepID=UPI0036690A40
MKARFLADVVQTGTVLGLDANMGPDVAAEVMGGKGGENRFGRSCTHSHGLVEISWYERLRGLGWQGVHLAVQAHRLKYGVEFLDDAVAAHYGRFGGLLAFEELEAELARRGVGLVEVGPARFWQPDAQVVVHVEAGAVHKVFTAFGQDFTIAFDGDPETVWRQVKAVAAMSPEQRVRWAERAAPRDFRSWWRYCARLTAGHVASHDAVSDRQTFVDLAFWMWDHGLAKGVYLPEEVALSRAEFVARLDERYPELVVPSHDELVDACLDHVSEGLTRTEKNLVDAAYLLRHNLTDPARLEAHHQRRISRR